MVVSKLSKKQKLINICQQILNKKEIEDIIIIGSFIKGKEKAKDIDLCFVFNQYDDKILENAYSKFEKNKLKAHITKTKFSYLLEDPSLWKSIIHEGYSILKKNKISKILGINSYILFEYNLKKLDKIKKQIFSHALYGTGGRENFLKKNNGFKIGKSSVVVPLENSEKLREFFNSWDIIYKVRRIWL